jgi:hypothetical protein
MRRTPSVKSLRAGQTIYYAAYVLGRFSMVYQLRAMTVLSDRAELAPPNMIADGFPRWFIREQMSMSGFPRRLSYSRRKVMSWIKAQKVTP